MAKEPGKGTLRIDKYKKHPQGPDLKGTLVLDQDYKAGDEIKLSAWNNLEKWESISVKVNNWKPDGQQQQAYPRPVSRDDNEVPF
jgi:hypothetical protein